LPCEKKSLYFKTLSLNYEEFIPDLKRHSFQDKRI